MADGQAVGIRQHWVGGGDAGPVRSAPICGKSQLGEGIACLDYYGVGCLGRTPQRRRCRKRQYGAGSESARIRQIRIGDHEFKPTRAATEMLSRNRPKRVTGLYDYVSARLGRNGATNGGRCSRRCDRWDCGPREGFARRNGCHVAANKGVNAMRARCREDWRGRRPYARRRSDRLRDRKISCWRLRPRRINWLELRNRRHYFRRSKLGLIRRQMERRNFLRIPEAACDIAQRLPRSRRVSVERLRLGLSAEHRSPQFFLRGSGTRLVVGRKNFRAVQIFVRVNVALAGSLLFAGACLPGGLGRVLRILLRVARLCEKLRRRKAGAEEKNCQRAGRREVTSK